MKKERSDIQIDVQLYNQYDMEKKKTMIVIRGETLGETEEENYQRWGEKKLKKETEIRIYANI